MLERGMPRPLPNAEEHEHGRPPLIEILKANARRFHAPQVLAVVQGHEEQHGEAKVHVDVPGFVHVDLLVSRLLAQIDAPELHVKIPSTIVQVRTEPELITPDGPPMTGPLPVDDETIQQRLDHLFGLVGGTRRYPTDEEQGQVYYEKVSPTNLGSDIYIIEERGRHTVGVSVRRMSSPHSPHRKRVRRHQ